MKPVLFLAGLAFAAAAPAQTFVAPQTLVLPSEIDAARVADLDGDGNHEALFFSSYASVTSNNGTLFIADADATGTFAVRASIRLADFYLTDSVLAVARGPGGATVAVAGANNRLWAVTWDGAAFTSRPLATALANVNLEAVDLDGDGVDEIVSQSWSSGAAVFGFTPEGALVERYRLATGAAGYNDLATGDLNGDGHADVVVMSGQSYAAPDVQVFPGDGTGALGAPTTLLLPEYELGRGVAVGDVNADGRDDLVVSRGRNSPTWIWYFLQRADGTLDAPVTVPSHDIPADLLIADFDLDGLNEVVVEHSGWSRIGLYRSDAQGIIPGEEFVSIALNDNTFQMFGHGDVDDDGCPDLVAARGRAGGTWLRTRECVPPPPDATPDAFAFAPRSGVLRGTTQVSEDIVVAGIDVAVAIAVSGGEYRVNGGAFTAAAGTVSAGDRVALRHVAAADFSQSVSTLVSIGGVEAAFETTTEAMDATPAAFVLADVANVATNTLQTSAPIVVAGINVPVPVSIANASNPNAQTVNPRYSINGGAFVTTPGTVQAGDSVRVQQVSSVDANTPQHAVLTIGGVSDTFTSTTGSVDTTPAGFAFVDVVDAKRNKYATSAPLTPGQYNASVAIAISGANASYAINNGPFTAAPGTLRPGDRVTLRLLAPNASYTTVSAIVTIGGVSDTWNVKTGR